MKLSMVMRVALVAVACTFAIAPPAPAQVVVGPGCSVTQDAYGPGLCETPPPERGTPPPPASALPFTGAEAGLAGGLGLLLLAAGVAMRRACAPRRSL